MPLTSSTVPRNTTEGDELKPAGAETKHEAAGEPTHLHSHPFFFVTGSRLREVTRSSPPEISIAKTMAFERREPETTLSETAHYWERQLARIRRNLRCAEAFVEKAL